MSVNKFLSTIAKLNILSLGSIHLINRWISSSAEANKKLLPLKSGHFYHWTYGRVFYTVKGEGTRPILLIHDTSVTASGSDWDKLIPFLSKKYKVYTLDLPGCGRSDKPAVTYSNYLYVRLIQSFIKDVAGEDTTVVADSLSSSFVFMAAAFEHSGIDEIYAINPLPLGDLASSITGTSRLLRVFMSLPVIGTCIYHMATSRRNIEFDLAEKSYYNPFQLSKVKVEKSYVAAHLDNGNGRYLLSSLKGRYVHIDIRHVLPNIDVPVTLIMGEKADNSRRTALAYKKLNPTFIIETILHTKEMPQEENPSRTASCIL